MSLKGHKDDHSGGWWSGWKRRHWPADALRRGLRFYVYDKESRSLFGLVEITKGSSFTYRTLAEFEKKVKQLAGFWPARDDPHWKKLPRPAPGTFCTGYAFRWERVGTVNIPWKGRFPQIGWARLPSGSKSSAEVDSTATYEEGDRKLRKHLAIERNPKLRAQAKDFWRAKLGRLRCSVCGFDFEHRYGLMGAEFIEMHHVRPLASGKGGTKSRVTDLKPLCANCHRMIHHKRRVPLSLPVLKRRMRLTARSKAAAR